MNRIEIYERLFVFWQRLNSKIAQILSAWIEQTQKAAESSSAPHKQHMWKAEDDDCSENKLSQKKKIIVMIKSRIFSFDFCALLLSTAD